MPSPSDQFVAEHQSLRVNAAELRQAALRADPEATAEQLRLLQSAVRKHFEREELFYRILDNDKRVGDRGAMHQVRNDHAAIIFGLESLVIRLRKNGVVAEWSERLEKLLSIVISHFDQEEQHIFPEGLRLVTAEELKAIEAALEKHG